MDLIQAQDILTFAYLGNDEFIREKTNGRKNTIGQQWDRCYRIDNGVDVCHPLQQHQFSIEAIPYRTMPAQKNFNGSQSPPEHLIQSIRKIDGSRTLECWARRHTIYWNPSTCMHLKPSQNIFCDWTINPSDLKVEKGKLNCIRNH